MYCLDVIRLDRTDETFRLLYDVKGRFATHRISKIEGQMKLCKVVKQAIGAKSVPYIATHDGRTIRYPDPRIKAICLKLSIIFQMMKNYLG